MLNYMLHPWLCFYLNSILVIYPWFSFYINFIYSRIFVSVLTHFCCYIYMFLVLSDLINTYVWILLINFLVIPVQLWSRADIYIYIYMWSLSLLVPCWSIHVLFCSKYIWTFVLLWLHCGRYVWTYLFHFVPCICKHCSVLAIDCEQHSDMTLPLLWFHFDPYIHENLVYYDSICPIYIYSCYGLFNQHMYGSIFTLDSINMCFASGIVSIGSCACFASTMVSAGSICKFLC